MKRVLISGNLDGSLFIVWIPYDDSIFILAETPTLTTIVPDIIVLGLKKYNESLK